MGGTLSCVGAKDNKEMRYKGPRPNEYDEIDDNLAIVPRADNCYTSSSCVATKENKRLNETRTNCNESRSTNDNVSPGGLQTESRMANYRHTHTYDNATSDEMVYTNVLSNPRLPSPPKEIQTSSNYCVSDGVKVGQNSRCQSKPSPLSSSSANRTGDLSGKHDVSKDFPVYAQVKKTKVNKGNFNEETTPKPKIPKKAMKSRRSPSPPPPRRALSPVASGKEHSLNYIEVEFKSSPIAKKSDPATTYTDVVLDGGRLVLMR